jgi:ribose 5-phosphate isomerase B
LIASDHAGILLKSSLQKALPDITWQDLGDPQTDYPLLAQKLCIQLLFEPQTLGILICGTGIGMSIAANRQEGIRAALCENPVSARLSREHNHSNVLCLGARILAPEYACAIVTSWLEATVSQEDRHLKRIRMLA